MARRSTPLLILIWLLLIAVTTALWFFLGDTPPTEFGPSQRAPAAVGARDAAPTPSESVWTLTGSVRERTGPGIVGVRVDVNRRRVETEPNGSFEVPDLPWRDHDVTFWKDGYRLETRHVSPGERLHVRLRQMFAIHGVVQLPDGRAIEGHGVVLRAPDDTERETLTDAAGAFRFERVATGKYTLRAGAFADTRGAYLTSYAHTQAGAVDPVIITMRVGDAFTGHVRGPDGADIEGAVVYAKYYGSGRTQTGERTTTDAEGRFALVVPREQKCSVIVETPTPEDGCRHLRWYRHEILPDGGTLEVCLEDGHAIEGRIEGVGGVDVVGRRVKARRVAGNQTTYITEGRVTADGTFRIGGLWKARYQLRVSGAEAGEDDLVLTPSRSFATGTDGIVLRLHRARPLSGRVLNAEGGGYQSAEVVVRHRDLGFIATTKSKAEGKFEFPRVPPGTLQLAVRKGSVHTEADAGTWRAGDTNVEIRLPEPEER